MILKLFRVIALLEGVSLLLLFFVAMPLKYFFDYPVLVPYVGLAHGVLFLAFFVMLLITSHVQKWSVMMFVGGLIASLLPFGTFVFDAKIKRLEAAEIES